MESIDEDAYLQAQAQLAESNRLADAAPTEFQKFYGFDVFCLIVNRTIGSGIFATPSIVLQGAGSVGGALLLWAAGGIISICGLLVWLELGLTIPLRLTPGRDQVTSVSRSGGEKNYLEFIFPRPKYLATCMYGIPFIILGNLAGNAIAFGRYVAEAAGYSHSALPKGFVLGLAIAVLSLCILINVAFRKWAILLSNICAILKLLLLFTIILLGWIKAGGPRLGGSPNATENFQVDNSFKGSREDISSIAHSLLYVVYAYSGFEQPFYIMSEVSTPRKTFPRSTLLTMLGVLVLFVLTNVSYLCVVPRMAAINSTEDMASLFLERVFGAPAAIIAMKALIAFAIFGNILVQTYTAPRVKQEIAKEGIFLKISLFFASCKTSLWATLQESAQTRNGTVSVQGAEDQTVLEALENHAEQTPMAALGLHWITSMFLVGITSMLDTRIAYTFLVLLYAYVLVIGMGWIVSGGLLYTQFFGISTAHMDVPKEFRQWADFRVFPRQQHWFNPVPCIIYFLACGILLWAAFAKPTSGSPFSYANAGYAWYLIPSIGQSAWLWGGIWFLGMHAFLALIVKRRLDVKRLAWIVPDDDDPGQWIFKSEIVDHQYHVRDKGE